MMYIDQSTMINAAPCQSLRYLHPLLAAMVFVIVLWSAVSLSGF
jgi:hypothetical protein